MTEIGPLLIDTDGASTILGVPPDTLRFWRKIRTGPPHAKVGKRVMYRRVDLQMWVNEQFAAKSEGDK